MGIRTSIATKSVSIVRIPWELEYALQSVNNGYVYGNEKTTVDNLLREADEWCRTSRLAAQAGRTPYSALCQRHSDRYFRAAQLLEAFEGKRR